MIDCEVKISRAKNTDHYPIYGTIETNMKQSKKQRSDRCKPEKYWKPDADRMADYNRRIFELLWDKEEQKRKYVKERCGESEESKNKNEVGLETPCTPDNKGNEERHEIDIKTGGHTSMQSL